MFIINLLYDLPCFISLPAPSAESLVYHPLLSKKTERLEVVGLFNLQPIKVILAIQSNISPSRASLLFSYKNNVNNNLSTLWYQDVGPLYLMGAITHHDMLSHYNHKQ